MAKKITVIPLTKPNKYDIDITRKRVGIYCRVSSAKKHQLRSLSAQASGLTQFVATKPNWRLYDIYLDVASGSDNKREEYNRMLDDVTCGKIDLVVVKSSSRLGRDTAETIQACRELIHFDCDIYFHDADSYYSQMGALVVEMTAAIDQADNESRSENIRWGIRKELDNTDAKRYNRVCYGYDHDEDGKLIINEEQATIVRKIFLLYLSGASILTIKRTLEDEGIPAPRGGEKWSKKSIDAILKNSKYTGDSTILSRGLDYRADTNVIVRNDAELSNDVFFTIIDHHPAIISKDTFEAADVERKKRSNITVDAEGRKVRKSTHYSSKKKNPGE